MSVPLYESVTAVLLIFVLPGFALSRAVFPEWRFRGPGGTVHAIETVALSLVLSVSLTILVGFGLANSPGTGFSASWSDPTLEVILLVLTIAAFVIAYFRGAFSRELRATPEPTTIPPDWPTLRKLDQIARERSHLTRALQKARGDPAETKRIEARLHELKAESDQVKRQREAEFVD